MQESASIHSTIDHLFRHEYAKIISYLTSKFGASHIDSIEDAVQDTLYKAMRLWSFQDLPKHPGKWLYRTAHNALIDHLRRSSKSVEYNTAYHTDYVEDHDSGFEEGIEDELLKMIFACCHPSMKEHEQIMLSLKLLCGFSNNEIARALFKEHEAVKKALTRAKQKFKTEVGHLEIPSNALMSERLEVVLKVLYLLFNNGYTAYDGDEVLKRDVCEEAIRLTGLLYYHETSRTPETKALLAIMCFNFSRFDTRTDDKGNLLTMANQDWSKWDQEFIRLGVRFLEESADGDNASKYHFEAGIAFEYARAKSFDSIDWNAILQIYTGLQVRYYSPSIALNRLVVFEKVEGAKKAYSELLKLDENQYLKNHLYYAIKADFEEKLELADFRKSLKMAIELTSNKKEKAFLTAKL